MIPLSASGPRRRCATVGLFVTLLALLAGCGGGDEGGTEQEAARAKLLAAADRLADAPSMRASIAVEAFEGDVSEQAGACFDLAVIAGEETAADDQVRMRTYAGECGGDSASELIVIGRDVWATQAGDQWARGRISPEMVDALTDEDDQFEELIEAASDIRPGEAPRTYELTAPSSAFSRTEDIGDVDVDFVLGLDERESLRSLDATLEAEGVRAVVDEDFEVGGVAPLRPPPAGDVVGPVREVSSEADLEQLLEPAISEGFE